jgi:hypothetical protein
MRGTILPMKAGLQRNTNNARPETAAITCRPLNGNEIGAAEWPRRAKGARPRGRCPHRS